MEVDDGWDEADQDRDDDPADECDYEHATVDVIEGQPHFRHDVMVDAWPPAFQHCPDAVNRNGRRPTNRSAPSA